MMQGSCTLTQHLFGSILVQDVKRIECCISRTYQPQLIFQLSVQDSARKAITSVSDSLDDSMAKAELKFKCQHSDRSEKFC